MIYLSLLLIPIAFYLWTKHQSKKHFVSSLESFNLNRENPLSADAYKLIYNFENSVVPFPFPFMIRIKDSNHRNGDELVTNKNRDIKKRIIDHLNLNNSARTTISSLGYDFKHKKNLIQFIVELSKAMPKETSRAFPINGTWFLISKGEDKLGVSFQKDLF